MSDPRAWRSWLSRCARLSFEGWAETELRRAALATIEVKNFMLAREVVVIWLSESDEIEIKREKQEREDGEMRVK